MTPEAFASALISSVDSNIHFYRESLEHPEGATDPYWLAASQFYGRLTAADREVVISMMQQAAIDALSTILGVLDGTSTLEGFEENFILSSGKSKKKLNGDLQDLFLAEIQEHDGQ